MKSFSPRKQSIGNILISSLGSFIAGTIGTLSIVILTFFLSNYFNVVGIFSGTLVGIKISPLFPFILSIITILGTSIGSFLTYKILNMIDPEKYQNNKIIYGQLAFFQVICYILFTPLYIYTGIGDFSNIMYVYLFHIIITIFGTSILIEIFSNYRYILTGFYGSIIGFFFCILFSIFIFNGFGEGYAKMIILILLFPLGNFIVIFLKQLFELIYYYYYKYTSIDPLGDIFYQIEVEEERKLREEEEKNLI